MIYKILLILLCLNYYFAAGLAINVGYHRSLSHRSVKLKKWLERALVTLGLPAGTPVQWVGNHRFHHTNTDNPLDPHSPLYGGFWHAHVGWYISSHNPYICLLYSLAGPLRMLFDGWNRPRTNQRYNYLAKDIAQDPYYSFISRPLPFFIGCLLHVLLPFSFAYYLSGMIGILVLWLTLVIVYNLGDSIDSIAHLFGSRPFEANHFGRNHFLLGYLALGEGWHANHHTFPDSARFGLFPGQFDWAWEVICLLKYAGLASEVKTPSPERIKKKLLKSVEK
jgi:stearoyl-CoA desaturase (delta-9 desaturase)